MEEGISYIAENYLVTLSITYRHSCHGALTLKISFVLQLKYTDNIVKKPLHSFTEVE